MLVIAAYASIMKFVSDAPKTTAERRIPTNLGVLAAAFLLVWTRTTMHCLNHSIAHIHGRDSLSAVVAPTAPSKKGRQRRHRVDSRP